MLVNEKTKDSKKQVTTPSEFVFFTLHVKINNQLPYCVSERYEYERMAV